MQVAGGGFGVDWRRAVLAGFWWGGFLAIGVANGFILFRLIFFWTAVVAGWVWVDSGVGDSGVNSLLIIDSYGEQSKTWL
jgi:hypothetical protein